MSPTPGSDVPLRPADFAAVCSEPPRRVPNATRTFWIADGASGERRQVLARLRVQTDRVGMWVEEGVWHDVRLLEEAAISFETQIYPLVRSVFGSEWTPGIDCDPRVYILHVAGLGENVMGYTSGADELPRDVYPYSNEAELITVNAERVGVASPDYYGLLARQFQRLVQGYQDRNEDRWVKEGMAELAVRMNGLSPVGLERDFLEHPDTSLLAWDFDEYGPHRAAAFLFAVFYHERVGDDGVRALVAHPANGPQGFDAVLSEMGSGLTFEDFFAQWLVANYLDGDVAPDAVEGAPDGVYWYETLDLAQPAPVATYRHYPVTVDQSVQQFGVDYIVLHADQDLQVQFTGVTEVDLLDVPAHSGRFAWWSNRADASMTTLTRAFDLSTVEEATLSYWAWCDVEEHYDYVAVEASADGGQSWQVLPVPSGTDADPQGNNPGWGYTGTGGDGPGWFQEEVDLSAYVGNQVWVRFVYLTDEAFTGRGFLLDDVAIPEIGYLDDVEAGDGGWQEDGFLRCDDGVDQRYLALLIGFGDTVTVRRLPIMGDGTAIWQVELASEGWERAVLVLSGLAPLTRHPAPYRLVVDQM